MYHDFVLKDGLVFDEWTKGVPLEEYIKAVPGLVDRGSREGVCGVSVVTIPDARDQLRGVIAERRQIFGHEPTVEQANAFLVGFDVAWGYALLRDYHEWLIVKLGGGYNIHWFALARNLAMGIGPYEAPPADHRADDESEIGTRVLESVIEFLDEVDRLDGRRAIYARYESQRAADGLS